MNEDRPDEVKAQEVFRQIEDLKKENCESDDFVQLFIRLNELLTPLSPATRERAAHLVMGKVFNEAPLEQLQLFLALFQSFPQMPSISIYLDMVKGQIALREIASQKESNASP